MNSRTILLTVSLLVNAGLLAAYLAAPSRPATSTVAQRSSGPASATAPSAPAVAAQPDAAATATKANAKAGFSWAAIETNDLDELVRRLKAAGFTTQEIRTILGRRIAAMTSQAPGTDAAKPTPYWRTPMSPYTDPKAAAEMRKRYVEQDRLYRKYLGGPTNLADDPEQVESAKRQWGDLPVEKLQAIATIEADYQEMQMKQIAERTSRPGEESGVRDAVNLLQKEHLADIAKLLTPEEFAVYELRASPASFSLRYRLETFKPDEEEFKAIFAINKAYDYRLWDLQISPDARKALGDEITAKVKDVLGAERALDYDAAVNHNSQDQTAGLVSRLGLPARVAVEVRQAQADFTQRAKDIRANPQLPAGDRTAQLDALARQAEAQLTARLGADGYEAYNDIKGEWLRALKPKTGPGGP